MATIIKEAYGDFAEKFVLKDGDTYIARHTYGEGEYTIDEFVTTNLMAALVIYESYVINE